MIIGISGLIGAGKDTIADYLVNLHGFRRESFANSLKDAVAHVFSWDRELLEGRSIQARAWREIPDPWWAERLDMPNLTPRWVLQHWGTEVCRRAFHDDIWIAALENKLRKTQDDIVISDVRFPNEIKAIKNAGGTVIRVKRGPDPEWYDIAEHANQGRVSFLEQLARYDIHISETAWIGSNFDAIIDNGENGLDQLYEQVEQMLSKLKS